MSVDLATEHRLTAHEATRLIPSYRPGQPTHHSRIIRAITKGSRAIDGTLVRLEAVRLGGQWITSVEAIQRWAERLAQGQPAQPVAPRTSTARRKAVEHADRELEKLGV